MLFTKVVNCAPWTALLLIEMLLWLSKLKFESGAEKKNLPARQGANGPRLLPGIQEFVDPHHPQVDCFIQSSGRVVQALQVVDVILSFLEPS